MVDELAKARKLVDVLKQNLPTAISVAAMGVREKTPYNLLSVRESLAWRTEELARGACDMIERDDLASGVLLTRAVIESAAFIFRLKELLETRAQRDPEYLRAAAMQMIAGWKNDPAMPRAVSILTLINHMERRIPGAQRSYDNLSEFAHPNWSGVAGLFSEIDHEAYATQFGKGWSKSENVKQMAATLLAASLDIFCYSYNAISEVMPKYLAELTPL